MGPDTVVNGLQVGQFGIRIEPGQCVGIGAAMPDKLRPDFPTIVEKLRGGIADVGVQKD